MASFISNILHQIGEFFHGHGPSHIIDKLLAHTQGPLHDHLVELVDKFREDAKTKIPPLVERHLNEYATSGKHKHLAIAWEKGLKERVQPFLTKLIDELHPHIDQTAAPLPDTLTQKSMEEVKNVLHSKHSHQSQEPQQQQLTRDLDLGSAETKSAGSDEQLSRGLDFGSSSSGSESKHHLHLFHLSELLPEIERKIKEVIHPHLEEIKGKIWDKIPLAFRAGIHHMFASDKDKEEGQVATRALDFEEESKEKETPASTEGEGEGGEVQERGLFNFVKNHFGSELEELFDSLIPDMIERFKEPIQKLIHELVDFLEKRCVEGVNGKVTEFGTKLGLFHE